MFLTGLSLLPYLPTATPSTAGHPRSSDEHEMKVCSESPTSIKHENSFSVPERRMARLSALILRHAMVPTHAQATASSAARHQRAAGTYLEWNGVSRDVP